MASFIETSNQFKYSGKGPLDYKSLVKTFAELLDEDTWKSENGSIIAYNGMIVSVWLNKQDTSKNGIYYLFDPNCTSTIKTPDVKVESNWVRLGGVQDTSELIEQLEGIQSQLDDLDTRLSAVEGSKAEMLTYAYRTLFPAQGEANKLYIAADQQRTYVWIDGSGYVLVGTGFEETEDGHVLIDGGSADDE